MRWLRNFFGKSADSVDLPANVDQAVKDLTLRAMSDLECGLYKQAEPRFVRALAMNEKAFGPENLKVADSLNWLATLYIAKNDNEAAEIVLQRMKEIREKALGPGSYTPLHLDFLILKFFNTKEFTRAEPLLNRLILEQEKSLGPDHLEVGVTLTNLASVCIARKDIAQAELYYQRVLAIRMKTLGFDNQLVVDTLTILNQLCSAQGKSASSQPIAVSNTQDAGDDAPAASTVIPKKEQNAGSIQEERYALCLSSDELQGIISGRYIPDPPRGYQQKVQVPTEVAKWALPVVEALESADSFANGGNLDVAFVLYTDILKSGIRCGVAAMSASFCCFHQDKWDLALKYIMMAGEYDPVNTRIKENLEYIVAECANRDVYEATKETSQKITESGKVRLVEKKQLPGQFIGLDTYEVYQADTSEDAKAFLNGRNIVEQQYYLIVETPEGIFGKDKNGFYSPSKAWRGEDWDKY